MKTLNKKQFRFFFISSVLLFLVVAFNIVSAAEYVSLRALLSADNVPLRSTEVYGPNGCPIRLGDSLETCDVEPGSFFMTADATLTWGAGFPSPLPAMGMGQPGLGYIPSSYPLTCAASSSYPGSGPGNSGAGGKICEITFDETTAGSGSAFYYIYVDAGATRGERYLMGLTSNGGSNTLAQDFYVRVKPLVCTIQSFTCDANATLAWSTANCAGASIDGGIGIVPVPTGSKINNSFRTIYTLTATNSVSSATSPAACGSGPAINAKWVDTGTETMTINLTPGQNSITLPLNFWNAGASGSVLKVTGCDPVITSGQGSITVPPQCSGTLTAP
ncbi:MAG: hypothetical protein WC884_02920 [Candidatus Paceibacterota bacterium]